jgi:hypothetical protein
MCRSCARPSWTNCQSTGQKILGAPTKSTWSTKTSRKSNLCTSRISTFNRSCPTLSLSTTSKTRLESSADSALGCKSDTHFCTAIERILIQLHVEIFRSQQTHTFEVKHYMTLNLRDSDPKVNTSLEQLKAKAPSCLRLLLWPEKNENQLRLVNKFFDSALRSARESFVLQR